MTENYKFYYKSSLKCYNQQYKITFFGWKIVISTKGKFFLSPKNHLIFYYLVTLSSSSISASFFTTIPFSLFSWSVTALFLETWKCGKTYNNSIVQLCLGIRVSQFSSSSLRHHAPNYGSLIYGKLLPKSIRVFCVIYCYLQAFQKYKGNSQK